MALSTSPANDYPAEITGYVEPWIASPGETVEVKISSTEPELTYRLVRLVHGPQGTDTSDMKQEPVTSIAPGKCKGRFQTAKPGSFGIIDEVDYHTSTGVGFTVFFQSHLPAANHVQTIVSTLDASTKTGFAVVLSAEGCIEFWIGLVNAVDIISTEFKPDLKRWVELRFDIQHRVLRYDIIPLPLFADVPPPLITATRTLTSESDFSKPCQLLFAAGFATTAEETSPYPTNFFNGRIDSPKLRSAGKQGAVLAQWDFSRSISSDKIVQVAGNISKASGRVINSPTRAVTGHDWDGMESDWTKATYGYGAIHFHEDDLDDAAWETDFTIALPDTLRSGVYAIELEDIHGKERDTIPFFVRATPLTAKATGAKVAYIISTFTYLAYANEHVYDRTHLRDNPSSVWTVIPDRHAEKTVRRNDLGLSCYDIHNDRSGVIFSTAKRPILNMRPDYVSWNFHRPRGLSADLLMIEFLERIGVPYDIVCDHDMHENGKSAISNYGTIVTGSHPEYHTTTSLGAYAAFIKAGGSVMYLGGNGFYWSCATLPGSPHRVEIRRGGEGIRPFTCEGGDRIFSSNGQSGLLWRSRGMSPNQLFGVGTCAKGTGPGVPYKRTDVSKDVAFTWMFTGIDDDELLGEHGFGGGASGDEIDKCDYANGSPRNAVVLATSLPHSAEFGMFPEDLAFPYQNVLGPQTREVRSDMTYYESSGGGAVFSVGSINWLLLLGWNQFQNNIAQLTRNVLEEFIRRQDLNK